MFFTVCHIKIIARITKKGPEHSKNVDDSIEFLSKNPLIGSVFLSTKFSSYQFSVSNTSKEDIVARIT